ncbi:MAG TPA: hypothetical protein VG326_02845 [Tepidisphaeraceae bacterium]|nr:hypothetical protein [Tepidisphaeraceae bacterium]
MELIRRLPLKTLKNDVEHAAAVEMIGKLLGGKINRGAGDYLDALILIPTNMRMIATRPVEVTFPLNRHCGRL